MHLAISMHPVEPSAGVFEEFTSAAQYPARISEAELCDCSVRLARVKVSTTIRFVDALP